MLPRPAHVDELLLRLRQGDLLALGELFAFYRERLKKMVHFRLDQRLRGRIDASDVVQDVYLDAAQRVTHYFKKPSTPFYIWLRMIAKQRLVDVHRHHLGSEKRDARKEVSLGFAGDTDNSSACIAAQLVGHLTSPSEAAIRAELRARLEDTLNRMDDLDREVLALRHFEELGNNEVAEVLGIKKAAASNRYVRALRRLKDVLVQVPEFREEV